MPGRQGHLAAFLAIRQSLPADNKHRLVQFSNVPVGPSRVRGRHAHRTIDSGLLLRSFSFVQPDRFLRPETGGRVCCQLRIPPSCRYLPYDLYETYRKAIAEFGVCKCSTIGWHYHVRYTRTYRLIEPVVRGPLPPTGTRRELSSAAGRAPCKRMTPPMRYFRA